MLSTHTIQFNRRLIEDYIGTNLHAFLIFLPSLGVTDIPTPTQLTARRNLTMALAAAAEIPVTNGYSRFKCLLTKDNTLPDVTREVYTTSANFTAVGGCFSPVTHICYARGASLGRGDTAGTLIKIVPIVNAPYTVTTGVTFTHSTNFISSLNLL